MLRSVVNKNLKTWQRVPMYNIDLKTYLTPNVVLSKPKFK